MSERRKHLHCLGIGGIGVSAIARHHRDSDWDVSGCDAHAVAIDRVATSVGHEPSHIDERRPDMVVYSPAISADHPELLRAKELGIPVFSYPQALGLLSKTYRTVAVSGTHGKSTTTALLAKMAADAGLDPVVIVGARVPDPDFEVNYRHGKGKIFIVEGCEYRRGMLEIHPESAIITNIEEDHLDYYKDIRDIVDAFGTYTKQLPVTGMLVENADDAHVKEAATAHAGPRCRFGFDASAELRAIDLKEGEAGIALTALFNGKEGTFKSPMSGRYNAMNILAATGMALHLGVPMESVKRSVGAFRGIGRRFESIGELYGVPMISDYAHHPTALLESSRALMSKFPDKRVLVVFQPHQIDRTKKLAKEFVASFAQIPDLLLAEVYYVKGREDAGAYTDKVLADEANLTRSAPMLHMKTLQEAGEHVKAHAKQYAAVMWVGAGDIDAYARSLVASGNA